MREVVRRRMMIQLGEADEYVVSLQQHDYAWYVVFRDTSAVRLLRYMRKNVVPFVVSDAATFAVLEIKEVIG